MHNTIIYIIGFVGTGKYTVAKEICKIIDAKLIDNHYINNPIFNLIETDGSTPLPDIVWEQTGEIRKIILKTITDISPPEDDFVFTNQLHENDPNDRHIYESVANAAQKRNANFIPVHLSCSLNENQRRIVQSDRARHLKCTDINVATNNHENDEILKIEHPNLLNLDITNLQPDKAAQIILKHAKACRP